MSPGRRADGKLFGKWSKSRVDRWRGIGAVKRPRDDRKRHLGHDL
jgi:hypothetical protein